VTAAGPPEAVRDLVARCLPAGDGAASAVRLHQRGELRRTPGGRWSPWTGEEVLLVGAPGFLWRARWRMAPLVWTSIRDSLRDGAGRTEGRLWGLVPVVRGRGPEVDRGAAMRYLAELPWVPHAMRDNRCLRWCARGPRTLEVSTEAAGADVAVRLELDGDGDVRAAWTPSRPRATPAGPVATPWGGEYDGHTVIGGVRIPTRAEVHWDLPEGRWVWWRGEVTGLEVVRPG